MRPFTGRRFFLFMILLTFLSCAFLLRSYISVSIGIVDVSQFFLDFLLFFFKVPYPETGLALCGEADVHYLLWAKLFLTSEYYYESGYHLVLMVLESHSFGFPFSLMFSLCWFSSV